jgi:creatinine amidohydrolase
MKKFKLLCAGFVACLLSGHALAKENPTVWLEALTSPEVKERMAEGVDTIIIPTGGTEQNKEYLALGKHNAIVAKTSEMAATMLGNALVAPVIAYVPESGHMPHAGTISLRDETFEALLTDAATSFKQHGFKWIVFMGDSGGNQKPQENVATRLSKAWKKEGVQVVSLHDYYANNGEEAWLTQKEMKVENPAEHAGFLDTAELSAANSAYVREDMIPKPLTAANAKTGKALLMLKAQAAVSEIKRLRETKP